MNVVLLETGRNLLKDYWGNDEMGRGNVVRPHTTPIETRPNGAVETVYCWGLRKYSSSRSGFVSSSALGYACGKSVFEGNASYEIVSLWDSQLVARAVGTGVGSLHPGIAVSSLQSEFFFLWRNSVKPTAPFNLTPYAITLNACPEGTLKLYLSPTDCRLCPDQRVLELVKKASCPIELSGLLLKRNSMQANVFIHSLRRCRMRSHIGKMPDGRT
ncbi:hypothetical protein BDY19DRAFT_1047654 [Irpex rosettiformis]|uniref:Uncharacterized protein n=1 Tax=Irpex rosettiformis TaxID=378272 RepID=A0ACB8U6M8_9APHY|nr:hypothetical protein BDY19DRAFT_1047654 [Irpex rosettiformis]